MKAIINLNAQTYLEKLLNWIKKIHSHFLSKECHFENAERLKILSYGDSESFKRSEVTLLVGVIAEF